IHPVRGIQIGIEVPLNTVGQNRDARISHGKVAEKLRGMLDLKRAHRWFALDEDLDLAITHDGVVDLLALLETHICDELRNDLDRVEYVVPQDARDKRHDEGVLGRLFRADRRSLVAHLYRQG